MIDVTSAQCAFSIGVMVIAAIALLLAELV
jgi:hypothetical protein